MQHFDWIRCDVDFVLVGTRILAGNETVSFYEVKTIPNIIFVD